MFGSNYYKRLTMPYSNTVLHYVPEINRRDYAGRMRNWSDPTYDSDGEFVYWDEKQKKYVFWYEETGLKGEKTYILGKLPKNGDDPTQDNLLFNGVVGLSTNGELWRLERASTASTHSYEIFKLIDNDGRDLIKINHTMQAPKNNRSAIKYTTKSMITVMIAEKSAGKDRFKVLHTKWFDFTKNTDHTFNYQFQFWTTLSKDHFLKKKDPLDMFINFVDNKGNKMHFRTKSTLWISYQDRKVLLGETFEDKDYMIKPYSHKWISFVATMASHNYKLDMVCDSKAKFCNNILQAPTMCNFKHAMIFNEDTKKGVCAKMKLTHNKCWKNEKGTCEYCRPGFYIKGGKCLPCHSSCAFCNEKTCLKCKTGQFWKKGAKCQHCKEGKKIYNPAIRKCSPRKIMDYTIWDSTKNGKKRFFKLPVWKAYSKPKKVPKYEDIRMIIEYKLATFKTPVSMVLKNYFIKPKKKKTAKDKKFQTRIKYIRKEWFKPVNHKGVLKYVYTVRFLFKIKPNKKFILKIFPITRNSKYFKNLEVYGFKMSYTPYNLNPYLRVRGYKELNEADVSKPESAKTKVGSTSGKGGRAVAKKGGVDMMSNAVEDKKAGMVSRLDEQLGLENLNDMITKLT